MTIKNFSFKSVLFSYDQITILVNKPTQGTEKYNQNSILLQLKPNAFTTYSNPA